MYPANIVRRLATPNQNRMMHPTKKGTTCLCSIYPITGSVSKLHSVDY